MVWAAFSLSDALAQRSWRSVWGWHAYANR